MDELLLFLGHRMYLPLATGVTEYVSFILCDKSDSSLGIVDKSTSKSRALNICIACWKDLRSEKPLFVIPLQNSKLVNNITEKGPCIFVIASKDDYEFQCTDDASCKKWIQLFISLGCKFLNFTDLYRLTDFIGAGSFAKVYIGTHLFTGQDVVIKAVDKKKVKESNVYIEIEILRKICHPYIIRLYAAYEQEEHVCLVLEHLKGGELFDWISTKGPYSEEQARHAIYRVLLALQCLHINEIVHRDLKAENLILERENSPNALKIIDFGLASMLGSPTMRMRCGSPGYVAPEILQDQPYGPKVDVFSAGVILYTMLVGYPPFRGQSVKEILKKNLKCQISFNNKNWNNITRSVKDLIEWMCCRDPDRRCAVIQALSHPWFRKIPNDLFFHYKYRNTCRKYFRSQNINNNKLNDKNKKNNHNYYYNDNSNSNSYNKNNSNNNNNNNFKNSDSNCANSYLKYSKKDFCNNSLKSEFKNKKNAKSLVYSKSVLPLTLHNIPMNLSLTSFSFSAFPCVSLKHSPSTVPCFSFSSSSSLSVFSSPFSASSFPFSSSLATLHTDSSFLHYPSKITQIQVSNVAKSTDHSAFSAREPQVLSYFGSSHLALSSKSLRNSSSSPSSLVISSSNYLLPKNAYSYISNKITCNNDNTNAHCSSQLTNLNKCFSPLSSSSFFSLNKTTYVSTEVRNQSMHKDCAASGVGVKLGKERFYSFLFSSCFILSSSNSKGWIAAENVTNPVNQTHGQQCSSQNIASHYIDNCSSLSLEINNEKSKIRKEEVEKLKNTTKKIKMNTNSFSHFYSENNDHNLIFCNFSTGEEIEANLIHQIQKDCQKVNSDEKIEGRQGKYLSYSIHSYSQNLEHLKKQQLTASVVKKFGLMKRLNDYV